MSLFSVIDFGTGSIRNSIYNLSGDILDVIKWKNPILYPKSSWTEQDPIHWWTAVKETYLDLFHEIGGAIYTITATSQREGIEPVNEGSEPLCNIIIWLDGRTCADGDEIEERLDDQVISDTTGVVPNPAWSLSKVLWIKKYQEEIYTGAYIFLQTEDYLLPGLNENSKETRYIYRLPP